MLHYDAVVQFPVDWVHRKYFEGDVFPVFRVCYVQAHVAYRVMMSNAVTITGA